MKKNPEFFFNKFSLLSFLPKTFHQIFILSGERFDLEIQTDKAGGSYVIGIQGLQNCQGLRQQAFLNYENSDLSLPAKENLQLWLDERHEEEAPIKDCPIKIGGPKTLCSLDLKGFEDPEDIRISVEEDNEDIENYYIPFDVNTYEEIHDDMTDYSWNIYSFSYYPAYLSVFTFSIHQMDNLGSQIFILLFHEF